MEFVCLSIANKLDLQLAARVFALGLDTPWREHLCVGSGQLGPLLGMYNRHQKLYLFRSGCIVFQGFSNNELLMMLKFLSGSIAPIQYQQVVEHREALESEQLGLEEPPSLPELEAAVPFYLANSVELSALSDGLDQHLDCEEVLIERLRKGKNWLNIRYTSAARRKLILFQYRALSHATLLGGRVRIIGAGSSPLCEKLDDILGLSGRTAAFHTKMEHLSSLLARFTHEKLTTTMIRFYIYEVYLLAIFPFLHFMPTGERLMRDLRQLFAWVIAIFP